MQVGVAGVVFVLVFVFVLAVICLAVGFVALVALIEMAVEPATSGGWATRWPSALC